MPSAISRESRPDIVDQMNAVSLPARLEGLIDRYETVTSDRNPLLWDWLYFVFPSFRLSTVPDGHAEETRNAKFCFSLYMTVLDDLSERHLDRETFEQGRKIPFDTTAAHSDAPGADSASVGLLEEAWELTEHYLDAAPNGEDFRELFEFDLRQSLNTMDYNRLVNQAPLLSNTQGAELYDTHNMLLYIYVDIDLAFSPGFAQADLAMLREVTWDAQRLARIGNWVTTWERELDENDYTSAVITEAIRRDVVTVAELEGDHVPNEIVARRIADAGIEREFLLRWNSTYRDLLDREYDTESVDIPSFVEGMRHLLEVDVKARGHK